MSTCDVILPSWIFDEANCECLRLHGHEGLHCSPTSRHGLVDWMPDPECGCETCVYGEDPSDRCVLWQQHTPSHGATGSGEKDHQPTERTGL
jgi:hypothetical protein